MDERYLQLVQSERVGEKTRQVLLDRDRSSLSIQPGCCTLGETAWSVLRALTDTVIPQPAGHTRLDLAAIIEHGHRSDSGDGWRFDDMPPDSVAFEMGLAQLESSAQRLHQRSFAALSDSDRIDLLERVQAGDELWDKLEAAHWFEDFVANATEIYVSQPSTLHLMGFSGFAFRPAWPIPGETQSWEPQAQ